MAQSKKDILSKKKVLKKTKKNTAPIKPKQKGELNVKPDKIVKAASVKTPPVSEVDEMSQYKLNDLLSMEARSGAAFWYGEIWKTVNKCVFCDLRKRYVIMELDGMALTVNIYPYVDGNLMIVPKRHITYLKDLTPKEWEAVRALQYIAKKMLKAVFGYENLWLLYREGASLGAKSQKTVDHLHVHLMPFVEGLVEWHYQKVKVPPFEVASVFRDNKKVMEALLERYKLKHAKK